MSRIVTWNKQKHRWPARRVTTQSSTLIGRQRICYHALSDDPRDRASPSVRLRIADQRYAGATQPVPVRRAAPPPPAQPPVPPEPSARTHAPTRTARGTPVKNKRLILCDFQWYPHSFGLQCCVFSVSHLARYYSIVFLRRRVLTFFTLIKHELIMLVKEIVLCWGFWRLVPLGKAFSVKVVG